MEARREDQISPTDPKLTTKVDVTDGRPWQTEILKHLPWTGLSSLLAALLCGIGAVVVAHDFDDKPLDHWTIQGVTVQPTVLLSVLATVSKACLGYAFTTGITIFWWRSAVIGTSLHQLHVSHQQSNSLQALFAKRPKLNSVAFASIATLLLMAEGPLLQRALHVVTRNRHVDTELIVPISSSPLMTGSTGLSLESTGSLDPQLYTPSFAEILQQYNARKDIILPEFGCQGTCVTDIVVAGWDIECSTNASEYTLMSDTDYEQYSDPAWRSYTGPPIQQVMFDTNVTIEFSGAPDAHLGVELTDRPSGEYQMGFSTLYKATEGLQGTMMRRTCTCCEATSSYPVEIKGQTVMLLGLPLMTERTLQNVSRVGESMRGVYRAFPQISGEKKSESDEFVDMAFTVGGLWLAALKDRYETSATVSSLGTGQVVIKTNSTAASVYVRGRNTSSLTTNDVYWADPTDDMLSMPQELTFRAAVSTKEVTDPYTFEITYPWGFDASVTSPNLTATNRTVQQQANVSMTFDETVYIVRYGWLMAAFTLVALACLAILPTYWGWWLLGRPVSLSPLEIAKAFDAPLLHGVDSNGTSKELARAIGDVRVRYEFEPPSEARLVGENYETDPLRGGGYADPSGADVRGRFGFRRVGTGHNFDE
jgi:hypothetical protein